MDEALKKQLLGSRRAAAMLRLCTTAQKDEALHRIGDAVLQHADEILAANVQDMAAARDNGMNPIMLDRLLLTKQRLEGIVAGVRVVEQLPDPVGRVLDDRVMENGLHIRKLSVPFGVIAMIYESRPNVTVDCAALCLKSGNCAVLRSGRDAAHTCEVITGVMRDAVAEAGLDRDCIQYISDTSRQTAEELMRAKGLVDLLIPRGGAGLIQTVVNTATVPVIETGTGNCHIYVDKAADLDMAVEIVYNAKTSRPSVCNAAESLVVHRDVAARFLPMVQARLNEKHVILYGCPEAVAILPGIEQATQQDFYTEYLDYKMSVKVVGSVKEAVEFINEHSTSHSECIVTQDETAAEYFLKAVDSAAVYHNASTRFTDGGEFGLGAEIGISTGKLHARGPMGLDSLTTTKFVVDGQGQTRG